jgi:hypothetical protein
MLALKAVPFAPEPGWRSKSRDVDAVIVCPTEFPDLLVFECACPLVDKLLPLFRRIDQKQLLRTEAWAAPRWSYQSEPERFRWDVRKLGFGGVLARQSGLPASDSLQSLYAE